MVANVLPVKMPPQTQGSHKKQATARMQGVEILRLLARDAIQAEDGKTRAFIARSWCDVNEELRKLAMRPVPRPIDTTKLRKRGSAGLGPRPSEPAD